MKLPTPHTGTLRKSPFDDPYIVSSLLHKAIRRGDPDWTERAAKALYKLRGHNVWRRLVVIAFEDIGIGGVELLSEITALAIEARRGSDPGLTRFQKTVARMCAATKERSTDYLMSVLMKEHASRSRRDLNNGNFADVLAAIADRSAPLTERAIAVWLASGIGLPPDYRKAAVDRAALAEAFGDLGAPPHLVQSSMAAATLTREPITLMVPLLASICGEPGEIVDDPWPPVSLIQGVPSFALDIHTRPGKRAFGAFATHNGPVRSFIERYAPPSRVSEVVGLASFYIDAAPLAHRLRWSQSTEIERLGIEADMVPVGMPAGEIPRLLNLVRDNQGHLDQLRDQALAAHLDAGSGR
jgi:hypothetical protein